VTSPVSVSIIVCTRDRPNDFARLLPTLLDSQRTPLEIIVVDQSSSDATGAVIQDVLKLRSTTCAPLIYLRSASRGLSRARNEGVRVASGDVCAFTDDDCTVSADWVGWIHATFETSPQVGLAFGTLAPIAHDPLENFVPGFEPKHLRRTRGPHSLLDSGAGANMVIRRDVFERVGAFDEDLGAGSRFRSGEDSDFAYRVARAGYEVVYDPAGIVLHWGTRPWAGGLARQLIFDGYSAIGTVYAKHARRGDWIAAGYLVSVALTTIGQRVTNAVHSGKLLGFRRLTALARGAWDGWRYPFEAA
jgi:GT2 family glycosyltransferase